LKRWHGKVLRNVWSGKRAGWSHKNQNVNERMFLKGTDGRARTERKSANILNTKVLSKKNAKEVQKIRKSQLGLQDFKSERGRVKGKNAKRKLMGLLQGKRGKWKITES